MISRQKRTGSPSRSKTCTRLIYHISVFWYPYPVVTSAQDLGLGHWIANYLGCLRYMGASVSLVGYHSPHTIFHLLLHDWRCSLWTEIYSVYICFSLATVTKSRAAMNHEISAVDVEIKTNPRGEVVSCGGEGGESMWHSISISSE